MIGAVGIRKLRIMPLDHVIRQSPHAFGIAARREILERSDADVARRDAGEDSAGQRRLAQHALAGHDRGQRSCGWNSKCRHRLADDVFAQHRTEGRAAIAPARKRRRPRTLQLNVAADAVGIDHLAEQDSASITKLRNEMTELVAGIWHRNRVYAVGYAFAGEDLRSLRAIEPIRIEAEMNGEPPDQVERPPRGS